MNNINNAKFHAYCKLNDDFLNVRSQLTPPPPKYGKALGQFVTDNNLEHLTVWTSHMKRTIQTSSYLPNLNIDR